MNKDDNGIKREEVKNFINKQREIYENILLEQKQQITSLKNKIHKLTQEIENYKRTEKELCDAFIYAMEQKNNIKVAQDSLYQLELQRVRDLYEKYRALFESQISENALIIEKQIDGQFNLLEEIGKDVAIEQAFEGFDFFENNPVAKKQEEKRKKVLEMALEIRKKNQGNKKNPKRKK